METTENNEFSETEDNSTSKEIENPDGNNQQTSTDELSDKNSRANNRNSAETIINQDGEKNYHVQVDGDAYISESSFTDPTLGFPDKIYEALSTPEILEEYCHSLQENQGIILYGHDERKLQIIQAEIMNKMNEQLPSQGYQKLLLSFSGENRNREDLNLEMFIKRKIGGKKEDFMVAINLLKYHSFLESMITDDLLYVEYIRQELKNKKIFLICSLKQNLFNKILPEHKEKLQDFLPVYSLKHTNQDKEYIESRGVFEKIIEGELNVHRELYKYVLFAIAFFPGMKIREFRELMEFLLEGVSQEIISEQEFLNLHGEVKKLKHTEIKGLIELWRKDNDEICNACHMTLTTLENSLEKVVAFLPPLFPEKVQEDLERQFPNFVHEQTHRILYSNLIFDPNSSFQMSEGLIELAVQSSVADPEYGCKLLWLIFSKVIDPDFEINFQNNIESLRDRLVNQIGKKSNQDKKIKILLADFIREILFYPTLQKIVNQFLEEILKIDHNIVLDLVNRLSLVKRFNKFYWLRKLLNYQKLEIHQNAYKTLLRTAYKSGHNIYEFLFEMESWIPDKQRKEYKSFDRYTLRFILEYCITTNKKLIEKRDKVYRKHKRDEYYGKLPPKHRLFATLTKETPISGKHLQLLISWLFHPSMEEAISVNIISSNQLEKNHTKEAQENQLKEYDPTRLRVTDFKDEEPEYILRKIRADIIEEWFVILLGLKDSPPSQGVEDTLTKVVKYIVQQYSQNREYLNEMTNFWKYKVDHKLTYSGNNREKLKEQESRRRIVKRMLDLFYIVRKQLNS